MNGTNIGAWIPQLFFDLIARVIPGFVTLCTFLFVYFYPLKLCNKQPIWLRNMPDGYPPTIILVGVGLVVSYIISIILGGLCLLFLSVAKKIGISKIDPETGLSDPNGDFLEKYNYIKLKDTAAGNRITKLKAEIHMTYVLIMGFIISLIVNYMSYASSNNFCYASSNNLFRYILYVLLFAIVGSFGIFFHCTNCLDRTVNNVYDLLQKMEEEKVKKE